MTNTFPRQNLSSPQKGTQIMEKGCKLCEKYKEHCYQDHLNGKAVEFYELMHGEFSQHVRIPKKFAHCFRKFSETVDLKGPSGKIWPVGFKETNNGMLLQSGWKEFVEAHHIQESYLLVFKFDEKSCIDVSIFDENRCKKAACYLFMDSNTEKGERNEDSEKVLNVKSRCMVDMRSLPGFPRDDMRHEPPLSTAGKIPRGNERAALKYQRTGSSCKARDYRHNELSAHPKNKQCNTCPEIGAQGTWYNIKQESVDVHDHEESDHVNDLEESDPPNVYISRRRRLTYEEIGRALQLFHLVQPNNPCFISILQPGSISNHCYMYVPLKFQKTHLPPKHCNIVLQVPDQSKKWCAELFVYCSTSRFCWESFVIDNSLRVGDACLFELADDPTHIAMTVSILRADDQDG